jgi:hypothetical protein
MNACGRYFSPQVQQEIRDKIETDRSISRRQLSLWVCERMGWRSENGNLQEMSCRKALLQLDERGVIELPEVKERYAYETRREEEEPRDLAAVSCSLRALGEVEIVRVESRYSANSRVWKGMMRRFHYLGDGPLCGAQQRYLIWSPNHGWLGGLSFSGATARLAARDEQIGWSERARWANLKQVVCNSRFLILPGVEVRCLASHVLSRVEKRLRGDWEERYGYEPVLMETYVDTSRYKGTCYRAANWERVGETTGRRGGGVRKAVWLRPLRRDWKKRLREEPARKLCKKEGSWTAEDWTEQEFGSIELHDGRLRRRVKKVAEQMFQQPGEPVAVACGGSYDKARGAYRLFANEKVEMETILKPHVEATVGRMREHKIVLAVQDTTTLNYTAKTTMEGVGPINTKGDHATGLILHDTLAFGAEEGLPLGILDAQCWARDAKKAGKSKKRKDLPMEQKESMKWLRSYRAVAEAQELIPETMVVSVGDREADIYELFCETKAAAGMPELLVRADKARQRKVGETFLWDQMSTEEILGYQELYIPGKTSRKPRTAKLAVRVAQVTLNSPKNKNLPTITLWAIYVREEQCPKDVKKPLEWMLLTTIETNDFEDACERIRWYTLRWSIEVYHKTLKSGCRIEDRRLGDAESTKACLAMDMVISWRVFWLTKQGRETPDMCCSDFLSEYEWKALCAHLRGEIPNHPPTAREAMMMIAKLGGHFGRKCDGFPGTIVMRRGIDKLHYLALGFRAYENIHNPRAP